MAKQALGPDTIPEGVSVDLDVTRLVAMFSWEGGRLELDLVTIAGVARSTDVRLRNALETQDSASGGEGIGSIRVVLTSEGCSESCELSLAAWAAALRYLDEATEAVGINLGER